MIVKKYWHTYKHQFKRYDYMGIFLYYQEFEWYHLR